jgi:hypothetical protein
MSQWDPRMSRCLMVKVINSYMSLKHYILQTEREAKKLFDVP